MVKTKIFCLRRKIFQIRNAIMGAVDRVPHVHSSPLAGWTTLPMMHHCLSSQWRVVVHHGSCMAAVHHRSWIPIWSLAHRGEREHEAPGLQLPWALQQHFQNKTFQFAAELFRFSAKTFFWFWVFSFWLENFNFPREACSFHKNVV